MSKPGHRGPPASQWEGHVARAAGDIQHAEVGFKRQPSDETLGPGHADGFGYFSKITGNPRGAHSILHLADVLAFHGHLFLQLDSDLSRLPTRRMLHIKPMFKVRWEVIVDPKLLPELL
jgi:hypothetical protein